MGAEDSRLSGPAAELPFHPGEAVDGEVGRCQARYRRGYSN